MNEQDTTTTAADVDIDMDDVEAHGIKEVMVGLSAAAVLTGGVAAVVSAGSDGSTPSPAKARIAADNLSDVDGSGVTATTSGTGTSIDRSGVLGGTGAAVGNDSVSLRPATAIDGATIDDDVSSATLMNRLDGDVDSVVDDVRDLRDGAWDTAVDGVNDTRATVRSAPSTVDSQVRQTRSATVAAAQTTVRDADAKVNQIEDALVSDVDKTLAGTLVLADGTIRGLEGTVTTLAGRVMPSASTNIDASTLTGTVTVSVGGEQIARADVKDGQFTLSYTAPRADAPIQVHYTGALGNLVQGL